MNAKESVSRLIHLGLVLLGCLSLNFMECKTLFATLVKGMAAMSVLKGMACSIVTIVRKIIVLNVLSIQYVIVAKSVIAVDVQ